MAAKYQGDSEVLSSKGERAAERDSWPLYVPS